MSQIKYSDLERVSYAHYFFAKLPLFVWIIKENSIYFVPNHTEYSKEIEFDTATIKYSLKKIFL